MTGKNHLCKILGALLLSGGFALAQISSGTILGTVSDSTGAVVPGATVTIRNLATGISRTLTADAAGRYVAPELALGSYEVTAEASGFQTLTRRGIEITVGRQAAVDFQMTVGAVAEQVTVTGEAPLIEATTTAVTGLISQSQMRDLPLNARSYEQLAFLQPQVFRFVNTSTGTNSGFSPKISAAGMRTGYNAYILDGIDVADTVGQTPGSVAGQLMGVETLREFRVLTNNYPAQYGNALGAIIEVASRSGGNDLHGTAFEFLRNDKMDARNFFDTQKPPFRRNQFGGILGGKIKKDRAFFFTSYEAYRDRLTTTNLTFVPTDDAKKGIFPDPNNPTQTVVIPVNPAVVPYLALYPSPQRVLGNGIGQYSYLFHNQTREDYVTGRLDYQRSEKVSYFARYSYDDTSKVQSISALALPPWAQGLLSKNQNLTIAETRIFTPGVINEFRAGLVRYTPQTHLVLTGPDPQIHFPGTSGSGNLAFTTGFGAAAAGVATLGVPGRPFEKQFGNTYQVANNLTNVKGAHSMRMGFNLERFQDNVLERTEKGLYRDSGTGTGDQGDTFTFESIQRLVAGVPRSFSGPIISAPEGLSGRVWLFAFYFQDDYHVRSNLTLNLGVRYEFLTPYSSNNNRFIVLNDLFGTAKTGQHEGWGGDTCTGCFDPRIGLAWDIFSNGKTVLKAGYGISRNQLLHFNGYFQIPYGTPGGFLLNATNPAFPNPTVAIPGAVLNYTVTGTSQGGVTVLPKVPHTPSAMQWNLTLDHQFTSNTTLRFSYLGSHGYHLESGYPANPNTYVDQPDGTRFFAPGVHRLRPDFGSVNEAVYDFNSFFDALTVTVGRRMAHRLGFEASYAYSRATDDTSVGLSSRGFISSDLRVPDGRRNTYHALSGYDIRNRFVSNVTYDLPSPNANGFAKKLLGGWQTNNIITIQAGTPLSVWIGFDQANTAATNAGEQQRPSLSPSLRGGIPLCPCQMPASLGGGIQRAPQRYFDPTAFVLPPAGTYGNAGRNPIIGPGLVNFDLALVKNTPITERLTLQFRGEAYNLFNNVNWLLPSGNLFQTNGALSGSAGSIIGTSTSSRQLQFALKLMF